MNIPKMEALRDWLLAGAPHVAFNMNVGLAPATHWLLTGMPDIEIDKVGIGECGTICCIAGAAVFLNAGKENVKVLFENNFWQPIQAEAIDILGLEHPEMGENHDLFEPMLAPSNCTPQEAAKAVQNMINFGSPDWHTVREE